MFKQIATGSDDRGQVGIGTLIVFIALVLVAAIAAGVLINTAGFLQTQAEATGQESTNQVSNTVDVISSVGTTGTDGVIETVTLTVAKGPGSDAIDLADAEAQLITDSESVTVTELDGTDTTSTAIVGSSTTLSNTEDRVEIEFDLTGSDELTNANPLPAGSDAELIITTADGSQTFVELSVPSPLDAPTEL
jgi:flagellin FlaB